MNRPHLSQNSIQIQLTRAEVWKALTEPEIAKQYFFGATIKTDWKEGNPIVFEGEYNGNSYLEKGEILAVEYEERLQYTHWSNLEGIPDIPENYRIWTFDLTGETTLTISEDNIPTEKQKERSDEFWTGVLSTIKKLVEDK